MSALEYDGELATPTGLAGERVPMLDLVFLLVIVVLFLILGGIGWMLERL